MNGQHVPEYRQADADEHLEAIRAAIRDGFIDPPGGMDPEECARALRAVFSGTSPGDDLMRGVARVLGLTFRPGPTHHSEGEQP